MSAPLLLSYRALGLGDLLTVVPALRGLRAAFPAHHHVLAAPAGLAPIAALLDAVDEHLPVGELAPLPAGLRPDVAVNLHGRGPRSHEIVLDSAPRRFIAFAHPAVPDSAGGPACVEGEHEVRRWCRLVALHGCPADPTRLDLPPPAARVPAAARGATIVHPGAKAEARRWPVERFAAVARHEHEAGRRVLVTGASGERPRALAVADRAGLPAGSVMAGRTDLGDLAGLVAAAHRVVCGDTGMAHLATALRTPSVLVFGPTSPARWGPPPAWAARHRVLWAGRTGDPLADQADPGLLAVTVDDVLRALTDLDRRFPRRPARALQARTAATA